LSASPWADKSVTGVECTFFLRAAWLLMTTGLSWLLSLSLPLALLLSSVTHLSVPAEVVERFSLISFILFFFFEFSRSSSSTECGVFAAGLGAGFAADFSAGFAAFLLEEIGFSLEESGFFFLLYQMLIND
jgi:hypothetical protein